jgi:hypothetical protein
VILFCDRFLNLSSLRSLFPSLGITSIPMDNRKALLYQSTPSMMISVDTQLIYCNLRLIVHKLQQGEIDGYTMVFGEGLEGWKQLMDVPELKEASVKAAQEEENTQAILTALPAQEEQVFVNEDGVMSGVLDTLSEAVKAGDKKYFVADDGVRYAWDDGEQDWVEDDEPLESENESESSQTGPGGHQKGKKPAAAGVGEKGDTEEVEGEGGEEAEEKQKRKRKKRKKKSGQDWNAAASKLWVYISGLPLDITVDEMKAHFSKVHITPIYLSTCFL